MSKQPLNYAASNEELYTKHESCDNVVTKSTVFDILTRRAANNNDQDAWLCSLRLVSQYRHRKLKRLSRLHGQSLPDVVFLNGLCTDLIKHKE